MEAPGPGRGLGDESVDEPPAPEAALRAHGLRDGREGARLVAPPAHDADQRLQAEGQGAARAARLSSARPSPWR